MPFITPPAACYAPIRTLPPSLRTTLTANILIPTLSVALQELVDNAIDAKAKRIKVRVHRSNLVITDDGQGIRKDDLPLVALAHTTNKLHNPSDLQSVSTLGFRGMALWALAARFNGLQLSSRADTLSGTQVNFDASGSIKNQTAIGMARGTTVSLDIRDWKQDTKNLKMNMIHAALCQPEVSFHFDSGSSWRSVSSPSALVAQELGRNVRDFRRVRREIAHVGSVDITMGLPDVTQTSLKKWMLIAVNGRMVIEEELCAKLAQKFSVRRGRYPVFFVHIKTKAELVDWTKSATKESVEIREQVRELIYRAIEEGIQEVLGSDSTMVEMLMQNQGKERDEVLEEVNVIGQALKTYIVVEREGGVELVEQHVADERARYEKLVKGWYESIRKVDAIRIELSEDEVYGLTSLGIEEIEECGEEGVYEVCQIPEMMSNMERGEMVKTLKELSRENGIEEAAARVACRTAVRNGRELEKGEMERIVRGLWRCENIQVCPHGRRIRMRWGEMELAKGFGRWKGVLREC